ncbi:hypothetical protein ACFL1Q_01890 [Patescibacteria group bacterium]
MSNKCIRCGKDRFIVKTYKERVGSSYVTYNDTSCPDPECQKKVEKGIQKEKIKRTKIKNDQDKREAERASRIKQARKRK